MPLPPDPVSMEVSSNLIWMVPGLVPSMVGKLGSNDVRGTATGVASSVLYENGMVAAIPLPPMADVINNSVGAINPLKAPAASLRTRVPGSDVVVALSGAITPLAAVIQAGTHAANVPTTPVPDSCVYPDQSDPKPPLAVERLASALIDPNPSYIITLFASAGVDTMLDLGIVMPVNPAPDPTNEAALTTPGNVDRAFAVIFFAIQIKPFFYISVGFSEHSFSVNTRIKSTALFPVCLARIPTYGSFSGFSVCFEK